MDPGRVAGREDDRLWSPESLPYDSRQVQAMIREYLAFGERFAKPSDMNHFEVRGLDDFYTDSRQAIQSELMGGKAPDVDPLVTARQKGQMVLALGEMLEERIAEMRSLEGRVSESQANFARVLGIESGEDENAIPAASGPAPSSEEAMPWERLLEPFLLFLPEDGALLFVDRAVRDGLEDRGICFSPLEEAEAKTIFKDAPVPAGAALARVRADAILSPESAPLPGDREFVLIFWKAGA